MRNRIELIVTWLAAFCLLGLTASATEIIAVTHNGDVLQYNTATGAYTVLSTNPVGLGGLGYTSGGSLYATDNGSSPHTGFYRVNVNTGALTSLGNISGASTSGFGDLTAPVAGGTLYYFDQSNDLYTVNPATGAATTVGATGFSVGGSFDLSFAPNGSLYATANGSFYELNSSTGAGTLIANTGQEIQGLIAGDGGLYGFSGLSMYSINLTTGALTFVRDTPGVFGNFEAGVELLTPTTSSPEPASGFLFLGGLVLAGMFLGRNLKTAVKSGC